MKVVMILVSVLCLVCIMMKPSKKACECKTNQKKSTLMGLYEGEGYCGKHMNNNTLNVGKKNGFTNKLHHGEFAGGTDPAPSAVHSQGSHLSCSQKELKPVVPLPKIDQNFLTSGRAIGVDTVSSSLKNPNLQLRPDIPIPKSEFMFNNSSIQEVQNDLVAENYYGAGSKRF